MNTIERHDDPRCWLALALASALGAGFAGCGAHHASPNGTATHGGAGGATSTAAGTGGAADPTAGTGGSQPAPRLGPAACYSPAGYQVCGGLNQCPYDATVCPQCHDTDPASVTQGVLSLCMNDTYEQYVDGETESETRCGFCPDGEVCIEPSYVAGSLHIGLLCVPYEVGVLFAQSGGSARVRYADHSLWTGAPLPEPASCPSLPGVTLCGGTCGACPSPDDVCAGRSPLHPYGLCVPVLAKGYGVCGMVGPCNVPGESCFTWKVQPEAQSSASFLGYCFPTAACKAAADGVPGGGICSGP